MTAEWSAVRCPTLRDAHGVYCPECDEVIAVIHVNPYWGIDKTRALHTRGRQHRPFYVRFVRDTSHTD